MQPKAVTWAECLEALSRTMRDAIPPDRPLKVLEAGCGRGWTLDVPQERMEITGVDLDPHALAARTDLKHAVHGDLQDSEIINDTYDVVYSQFVLEHIPKAHEAMRALTNWTAPGGKLIVIVPDSESVHGWAAKRTPHKVHIWAWRYIYRERHAGEPGHAPYPIHYSDLVTRQGLQNFADQNGLGVEAAYTISEMRPGKSELVDIAKRAIAALSFGRLAWRHDNLAYVLTRR